MTWYLTLAAMLPLLAIGERRWIVGVPVPWGPLARAWLALAGASFAAGFFSYDSVRTFAAIDFIAACIVLSSPRGEAQRLIGFLFGGMVFAHAGFYSSIAGRMQLGPEDFMGYGMLNQHLGWLQLAALLSGGIYAAYRSLVSGGHDRGGGVHIRVGAAS